MGIRPAMALMFALRASLVAIAGPADAQPANYDPLAHAQGTSVAPIDLTIEDTRRDRMIPLRVYLPAATSAAPFILFSHGLGGTRDAAPTLGRHWAGRGFVVVFLQHPGSDDAVWKNVPQAQRMAAMRGAASAKNLLERVRDVSMAIDQLSRWQRAEGHALRGRLDVSRIGVAGHSFGGATTQSIGGQTFMGGRRTFADDRVKAALVLSPSAPRREDSLEQAFARVRMPWLLMTGTKDNSPITDMDAAKRQSVYAALPAGDKYQLVLDGGEHSTFVDQALPSDRQVRDPNHVRALLAISAAFWDAHLNGDAAARAWIAGDGVRSALQPADRWDRK